MTAQSVTPSLVPKGTVQVFRGAILSEAEGLRRESRWTRQNRAHQVSGSMTPFHFTLARTSQLVTDVPVRIPPGVAGLALWHVERYSRAFSEAH